jgi:L-ascorbate metabolism protein UlaG (beta-lactamase superfamily)
MVITYYGASCFKVEYGDLTLTFDPPSKDSGLKPPRFEANVVLSSHDHPLHNGLKELSGKKDSQPFLISGPGEYEVQGLVINGIRSFHDAEEGRKRGGNTIYTVQMEDARLCHLGDLGVRELDAQTLEALGEIDILFVPTGGQDVLGPEQAHKIINQLEPKIVIPMHYAIGKTPPQGAKVEEFLEELGEENLKSEEKFSFKKKNLEGERTKVLLLKPAISL